MKTFITIGLVALIQRLREHGLVGLEFDSRARRVAKFVFPSSRPYNQDILQS
jgi:hypothetical protein